jgi:predicted NUDIX family NTP pyrophosphohydrolase
MILSAGLLMYRFVDNEFEFFLIHPGGPFYQKKNEGVWSIPKGLPDEGEDLLITAQREFLEETGITPSPPFYPLGTARTKSGKMIHAWAFPGNWNSSDGIKSNTFSLEWPPRSGNRIDVPEADRANWFCYDEAAILINIQQRIFLDRLVEMKSTHHLETKSH